MIKVQEQQLRALLIDGKYEEFLSALKRHESISEDLVEEFIEKVNSRIINRMCLKLKPSEDFIRKYKHKLNIGRLMSHIYLSEDLIEELISEGLIDSSIPTLNTKQNLSESFIDKYKDNNKIIRFDLLSQNKDIPLEIIDKYSDRNICWYHISMNIDWNPDNYTKSPIFNDFITKYKDKLILDVLFNNEKILDAIDVNNFISNFIPEINHAIKMKSIYNNDIDWLRRNLITEAITDSGKMSGGWKELSRYELLNEYMIRKHQDEVNWEYIFKYQPYLSEEFKKEFEDKLHYIPGGENAIYKYNNIIKIEKDDINE